MNLKELQESLTKENIRWDMYSNGFVSSAGQKINPAIRAWIPCEGFNETHERPFIRTLNSLNKCEIIFEWFKEIRDNKGEKYFLESWAHVKARLEKQLQDK